MNVAEADVRAADVPSGTSSVSSGEAPKRPLRHDDPHEDRKALLRDPEQRAELRKKTTVTKRELDGVTYWIDQSWGERKKLRAALQGEDADETALLVGALEACIVDVTGLKDGDENLVAWDGDIDGLPGPPLDTLMASLAVPDIPDAMRPPVPTPST